MRHKEFLGKFAKKNQIGQMLFTIAIMAATALAESCKDRPTDYKYKVIERPGNKGIVQNFYLDGKLKLESEVDITDKHNFIANGYCKAFSEKGTLTELFFMKNDARDSSRNMYSFLENGKLDYFIHDSVTVPVDGYGKNNRSWKSNILFVSMLTFTSRKADIINLFRVFRNMSSELHIVILDDRQQPWLDTIYSLRDPADRDNYPECAVQLHKTFPAGDSFTYLATYTLTDRISGISIQTDTARIANINFKKWAGYHQ